MQKLSKRTIGIMLVIVLCFSMMPMSAMATDTTTIPDIAEQITEEADGNEITLEPDSTDDEEQAGDDFGPTWPEVEEQSEAPAIIEAAPEYSKSVNKPFVQVVYHYYDEAQEVGSFSDYTVTSTHSYYTLATATDTGIGIAANKYPGKVPVSTDALRFRVLLNGSEDVTTQAAYDAATGFVSLPGEYADREITVVWYCPENDIVEIPVKITIGVFDGGNNDITEQNLMLASNANTIDIPLSGVDRIVVNQNGLDLFADEYSLSNGTLTVNASALGGDLVVSAFPVKGSGGISVMSGGTTVNHERQHYNSVNYGYVTSYYVANGNVAYCLDPSVSGVNTGTYNISGYMERGTGKDNIIKAAWYLYQCPGEDSSLFAGLDWEHAYGYSHVAASYIYLEIIGDSLSKAWEGIESNTAAQNRIMSIVNAIKAKPMPPEGFSTYLYNVGNQTSQSLMGWEYAPTGNLEIQKVSANTAFTSNNDCYSLEGAVFGVYNSSGKIGTITTGADGKGKLEGIDAGQTGLYIVEEKPPKGYAASDEKISFEIVSGQTTTVEVKNKPQGDPVTILLKKQDSETNTNTPQGGASLAGAQFTIKYYKGNYTESELAGKTPARTWIVKTDEYGFALLHSDYLVAGSSALYYASNGTTPTIPLGTVAVQETKAPTGYHINSETFVRQVTASGKMEAVNTYNEPIVPDKIVRGGVSIEKWVRP